MTSRHSPRSRRRSAVPLALSLGLHALLLAALWQLAPLRASPAPDPEPITIRMVLHPDAAPPDVRFERVRPVQRDELPPPSDFAPVPMEAQSAEDLLASLYDESSTPLTSPIVDARSGSIGVGAIGLRRVPRPQAASVLPLATAAQAPFAAAAAAPSAPVDAPEEVRIVPPVPIDCPAPEYPAGSASVGERGRVRLEITVGNDGRVVGVRVLLSSGFARLDDAACSGVRRWRFQPARRGGVNVDWKLEHTIVFRVENARS